MICRATLVVGAAAGAREAAIAAALTPGLATAIIFEGMADGHAVLAHVPATVQLVRIAPGCLCCSGDLVLRVHLNRLLRQRPAQLFISVADASHIGQLRVNLSQAPYDALLSLTPDLTLTPAVSFL